MAGASSASEPWRVHDAGWKWLPQSLEVVSHLPASKIHTYNIPHQIEIYNRQHWLSDQWTHQLMLSTLCLQLVPGQACSTGQWGRRHGRGGNSQPAAERHALHSANQRLRLESGQNGTLCGHIVRPNIARYHCYQAQPGLMTVVICVLFISTSWNNYVYMLWNLFTL